jgi:hypothetical protein
MLCCAARSTYRGYARQPCCLLPQTTSLSGASLPARTVGARSRHHAALCVLHASAGHALCWADGVSALNVSSPWYVLWSASDSLCQRFALRPGWQCAACLHYTRDYAAKECLHQHVLGTKESSPAEHKVHPHRRMPGKGCSQPAQGSNGVAELWASCARSGLPTAECRGNPATVLATTRRGGHCAHLQGLRLSGPTYMEDAAVGFFRAVLRADPAKLHPGLALGAGAVPERRHKRVARRPA